MPAGALENLWHVVRFYWFVCKGFLSIDSCVYGDCM